MKKFKIFKSNAKNRKDIIKEIKENKIDLSVKLKPFFGIKPEIYTRIILATIIILVSFFLFFYPGIKNYGRGMIIDCNTSGSAVFANNNYIGSTPTKIFLPAGEYSFLIKKTGYHDVIIEKKIQGRVFLTLFVPAREKIKVDMQIDKADIVINDALNVFAESSLLDRFSDNKDQEFSSRNNILLASRQVRTGRLINPYRPIITHTIDDFTKQKVEDKFITNFFSKAIIQTANIYQAKDIFDAASLYIADNNEELVLDFLKNLTDRKDAFYNFYISIPVSIKEKISDEFKSQIKADAQNYFKGNNSRINIDSNSATITNHRFTRINYTEGFVRQLKEKAETNILNNKKIEYAIEKTQAGSFYILNSQVTCLMFNNFLKENPEWNKDNNDLLKQGLVDQNYLDSASYRGGSYPATNISWYAAKAYCQWLGKNLPAQYSDFEVDLATSLEFQIASSVADISNANILKINKDANDIRLSNFNQLNDLYGNVWEWNRDYYSNSIQDVQIGHGVFKAVSGAAWFNTDESTDQFAVGGLPPSSCSPYTGFRIVLRKK